MGIRGAAKCQITLAEHAELVRTYRQITGIKCDVPMQVAESDIQLADPMVNEIADFCDQLNFTDRLRKRLQERSQEGSQEGLQESPEGS